ncbi:MAG: hypothetical protein MUE41_02435, partial [Gemmatimonadaceae bacterium]|nr:hypothetical protein [Gemmatimonadaceae bacterium]
MTTVPLPFTAPPVSARANVLSDPMPLPADRLVVRDTARMVVRDLLRNRWLLLYVAGFALVTELLVRLGGGGLRVIASLVNLVLAAAPLVSAVFTAVYWHAAQDFVGVLLAQPVRRRAVFAGVALGLVVPLAAAFVVGVSAPLLWHRAID